MKRCDLCGSDMLFYGHREECPRLGTHRNDRPNLLRRDSESAKNGPGAVLLLQSAIELDTCHRTWARLRRWRDAREKIFATEHITVSMVEELAAAELDLMKHARRLGD